MAEKYPLKLAPCYKNYLWGGNQLKRFYGKESGFPTTAESWELACRDDGMCSVENGVYAGETLGAVLKRNPDYIGHWKGEFPILVKLIDAKEDLSIQVHPSDATARRDLGEVGKAEMWYVISAEPQSFLYCGLKRKVAAAELIARAGNGTICELLNRVLVKAGDVFSIQPGTIHAIGKGLLIAEIQQNSNTTFRIYDYSRRDAQGRLRPLHLDRAVETAELKPIVPQECRTNLQMCFPDYRLVQMFTGLYFSVYKLEIACTASLTCPEESFTHLLVVSGSARFRAMGRDWPIRAGDSWLLPAGLGKYTLLGQCTILLSKLSEEAYDK